MADAAIVIRWNRVVPGREQQEDRFIDLMMRAAHACEGLGVNDAYLEGELQKRMARWTQIISE
jgi:hypothetical protein